MSAVCYACRHSVEQHHPHCVWKPRPSPTEALVQEVEMISGRVAAWRDECCADCGLDRRQCIYCWCHGFVPADERGTPTPVLRSANHLPMTS